MYHQYWSIIQRDNLQSPFIVNSHHNTLTFPHSQHLIAFSKKKKKVIHSVVPQPSYLIHFAVRHEKYGIRFYQETNFRNLLSWWSWNSHTCRKSDVREDDQDVLTNIFQLCHVMFTHFLNKLLITHTLIAFADKHLNKRFWWWENSTKRIKQLWQHQPRMNQRGMWAIKINEGWQQNGVSRW